MERQIRPEDFQALQKMAGGSLMWVVAAVFLVYLALPYFNEISGKS